MAVKYLANPVLLALAGIWTALVLVSAWIPMYPVFGTPSTITFSNSLLSSLTAPLLGPLWGTLAGFIFGWLVPYVNPSASIGLLTFLTSTMAALMSGLVLFNRWKEATLIFAAQMVVWFSHPFAWYQAMPIITWQYWLALALIVVPPIRKWIINTIVARDPKQLPIALWCLAWIAWIGGAVTTSNNIGVWINNWGVPEMYMFWVPMTIYYAVADSLNCLIGALIGATALLAVKKMNIRLIAVDFLQYKKAKHE